MKKINKNPGFKLPENYLEGFTEKILDKVAQNGGDSKAKQFSNGEGFTVPEGYFENLNQKILERLNNKETKVIALRPYKKLYYTAAAVAAGLVLIFGLRLSFEKQLTFSNLAATDIENYFLNNELDMSSYEIAEMFPIDQLE